MNKFIGCSLIFLAYPFFGIAEDPETITLQEQFHLVLEPQHRTTLSAEVRAPVKKVTKKLGEPFKKGEVLIQLDDTIYKANLERRQAEEEKTATALDAKQQLFEDDIASLFEVKRAKADNVAAIAQRIEAEELLDATSIKAP